MRHGHILKGSALLIALFLLEWGITTRVMGKYYYNIARERGTDIERYQALLEESLRYDSSQGLVYHTLAKALMIQDNFFDARDAVLKGLRSHTSMGAFKQLGSIYLSMGDALRAAEYFEQVLLMDPSDAESIERLATIARQRKDYSKMEYYLSEMERYHPTNPNSYYIEGVAYEERGDLWLALQSYRKALFTRQPEKDKTALFFSPAELARHALDIESRLRRASSTK